MRAVFMGTPEFAVPALEALAENHTVSGVVTQPDRQKGRGKKILFSPVKETSLELGIPVYQPEKIKENEILEILESLKPQVIIVAAYGQILPESILNIPEYGCLNIHASLLPKYRGAGPIQWAVLNGEKVSGVTMMNMEKGLDTGDMLGHTEVFLDKKETAGSLHDKLKSVGADLMLSVLKKLEDGSLKPVKQDDSLSSYAPMLTKQMGQIDFTKTAAEVERWIRGMNPWPGAYTKWNGQTVKFWDGDVIDEETGQVPGTVTAVKKDSFFVQTQKGQIQVKRLQMPGKKQMDARAFLAGYHLETGTVLGE